MRRRSGTVAGFVTTYAGGKRKEGVVAGTARSLNDRLAGRVIAPPTPVMLIGFELNSVCPRRILARLAAGVAWTQEEVNNVKTTGVNDVGVLASAAALIKGLSYSQYYIPIAWEDFLGRAPGAVDKHSDQITRIVIEQLADYIEGTRTFGQKG